MPENKKIEISQFNFYFITTLIGGLTLGIGTWASNLNDQVSENQMSMVQTRAIIEGFDIRFKDFVKLRDHINKLESDVRLLQVLSEANARDLASRQGVRFNMTEYDKYVRPVFDDIIQRVTRLEAKAEK